jgi:YebC/PmpR family DNA-binding regulatory protein
MSCAEVAAAVAAAAFAIAVPGGGTLATGRRRRHPAEPLTGATQPNMGRQWLHAKKEVTANRRAQITSKLVREIMVAAKMGTPDPAMNPRLQLAVDAARKQSVSNDVINRGIKKGSGQGADAIQYELVTYEGMGPCNVPVIIECLTENRNRTAPDIRMLFKDAQFGSKVMFLFDHVGIVEATHPKAGQDLESAAIEAGAQDVEPLENTKEEESGAQEGRLDRQHRRTRLPRQGPAAARRRGSNQGRDVPRAHRRERRCAPRLRGAEVSAASTKCSNRANPLLDRR